MIPTLKKKYEKKKRLQQAQEVIDPTLFLEGLDAGEIKRMRDLLVNMDGLVKGYRLPELRKGIKAATDEITKSISGRWARIKAGTGEVKADPRSLAKATSFETGLIKGLRELPDILDIIRQLRDEPKNEDEVLQKEIDDLTEMPVGKPPSIVPTAKRTPRPRVGAGSPQKNPEELFFGEKLPEPSNLPVGFGQRTQEPGTQVKVWDDKPEEKPKAEEKPDETQKTKPSSDKEPVKKGLSSKQEERLKGIMLNAFSPEGWLAMFRGLPWVNDKRMVDEILSLSMAELESLVAKAKEFTLSVPADRADIKDIAKKAKEQGKTGKSAKITIEPDPKAEEPKKDEEITQAVAPEPEKEKTPKKEKPAKKEKAKMVVRAVDTEKFYTDMEELGIDPEQIDGVIEYLAANKLLRFR